MSKVSYVFGIILVSTLLLSVFTFAQRQQFVFASSKSDSGLVQQVAQRAILVIRKAVVATTRAQNRHKHRKTHLNRYHHNHL
jgi:hypothetical protein